jgi:protein-S-isoprenylcysteine O-methyltransferase Ste14
MILRLLSYKRRASKMMGPRGEGWVALQAVLLILYATVPKAGLVWTSPIPAIVGWGLILAGTGLLVWSGLNLGRSLTPLPRPLPDGRLVTHGAYGLVRHPIYSAVIVCAAGLGLITENWPRLAMTALLFLFFDRKAQAEERWLVEKYPEYATYRTRVRKLIPWVY